MSTDTADDRMTGVRANWFPHYLTLFRLTNQLAIIRKSFFFPLVIVVPFIVKPELFRDFSAPFNLNVRARALQTSLKRCKLDEGKVSTNVFTHIGLFRSLSIHDRVGTPQRSPGVSHSDYIAETDTILRNRTSFPCRFSVWIHTVSLLIFYYSRLFHGFNKLLIDIWYQEFIRRNCPLR